jgi:hypothetical protein
VFASMGPCFYDLAYPTQNDPFEPLMTYLAGVNRRYPIWALTAQDLLRQDYLTKQVGFGAGISAFPSMHIAVAVLNAVLGWHLSAAAGWLLTAFAVLVVIGSVHLGWYYAVDAYASALAIPIIWNLSGTIVESGMPGACSDEQRSSSTFLDQLLGGDSGSTKFEMRIKSVLGCCCRLHAALWLLSGSIRRFGRTRCQTDRGIVRTSYQEK